MGLKKFPQQTNSSSALFPKFKVQFCIKEKRWDETRLTWWPPPEPAPGRRACCWQSWSPSGGRGRRWPPVTCWTLSPPSHPYLWVPMGENYVIKIFTKHHFKIYIKRYNVIWPITLIHSFDAFMHFYKHPIFLFFIFFFTFFAAKLCICMHSCSAVK